MVFHLLSHQQSVAAGFAANGLVIGLGRYRTEVPCFDAEFLSCHSHEKEILFFGSDSPLQIGFILKFEQGKWKRFALEIKVIDAIRCLARGFEITPRPSPNIQGKIRKVLDDVIHKNGDECHRSSYIRDLLHHQVAIAPEHIILDWGILDREYGFLHPLILRDRKERQFHFENLSKLFRRCEHFTVILDEEDDSFQATVDIFGSAIEDLYRIGRDMILQFQWNCPEDECMNDMWIALHVHQKQLNTLNITPSRDDHAIILNRKYNGITYISINEQESTLELERKSDSKKPVHQPQSRKIRSSDISEICAITVVAFCRIAISQPDSAVFGDLSRDVVDIILFMYAKPTLMKVLYSGKAVTILVCPVIGDWKWLTQRLQSAFGAEAENLPPDFELVCRRGLEKAEIHIDKTNWSSFRWTEDQIFTLGT